MNISLDFKLKRRVMQNFFFSSGRCVTSLNFFFPAVALLCLLHAAVGQHGLVTPTYSWHGPQGPVTLPDEDPAGEDTLKKSHPHGLSSATRES